MQKNLRTGIIVAMGVLLCLAVTAIAQEDVEKYAACNYCGMKRKMFTHSRMLITYDDASQVGTCSIHCAAVDLALKIDKTPESIQVGDYLSKQLIDAEKAVWVIGGKIPGVMTRRAKWAFQEKSAAEAFSKDNGGQIATFEDAMEAAFEDMYTDTQMIRKKRKAKAMKMQKTN